MGKSFSRCENVSSAWMLPVGTMKRGRIRLPPNHKSWKYIPSGLQNGAKKFFLHVKYVLLFFKRAQGLVLNQAAHLPDPPQKRIRSKPPEGWCRGGKQRVWSPPSSWQTLQFILDKELGTISLCASSDLGNIP